MEKTEVIFKQMKIESVSKKYLAVVFKALATIVVGIVAIQLFTNYKIKQQQSQLKEKELKTTISILKSDISEKISLIVNSQVFVDFLRSGTVSRDKMKLDLSVLFSNLREDSIVGFEIEDISELKIFSTGAQSVQPMRLPLCYLDNSLNSEYGRCIGYLKIFFSPKYLLRKIMQMNSSLQSCETCKPIFLDQEPSFGSFQILPQKKVNLNIDVNNSDTLTSLTIIEIVFFVIICFIFFIVHNGFNSVSSDYIYKPIKKLTTSIQNGELADLDKISVYEIKYLAECLNDYISTFKEQENLKMKASLGELAKKVAHDIRSPLSVIEILIKDNSSFNKYDSHVLENSLETINGIANELLLRSRNLSSVEDKLSPQYLLPILISVTNEMNVLLKSDKKIKVELSSKCFNPFVLVNSIDLKRVISNLIQNALESFNQDGGHILLKSEKKNNGVEISITDNGKGIPSEILNELLKSPLTFGKINGNGIGLSSAKEIIEAFSGKIFIESEEGVGTTVSLYLPIIKD